MEIPSRTGRAGHAPMVPFGTGVLLSHDYVARTRKTFISLLSIEPAVTTRQGGLVLLHTVTLRPTFYGQAGMKHDLTDGSG